MFRTIFFLFNADIGLGGGYYVGQDGDGEYNYVSVCDVPSSQN